MNMNCQTQEVLVVSNMINIIQSTLRHITVKFQNTKFFTKLLKSAKEKKNTERIKL